MTFAPDTPYEVWAHTLGTLQHIAGSVQWWLGDALVFGETRYGETYAQAIAETSLGYGHLANCKWVASRYESSLRNENVTWNHHVALADMEDIPQRQRLLERAAEDRWSVSHLSAMKDVAGRYEMCTRVHHLSWSHHRI